ncbi:MAG: hypothetical protein R3253_14100, partial [Longimicrobiales bacterium]|nr:hypothetical protein [Longimicrobiales bacterium]
MTNVTQSLPRGLFCIVVAISLFSSACGLSVTTPDFNGTLGTVVFLDVEGGCWGIETDEELVEPINLPEEFRTHGLAVRFSASEARDAASICQIGT